MYMTKLEHLKKIPANQFFIRIIIKLECFIQLTIVLMLIEIYHLETIRKEEFFKPVSMLLMEKKGYYLPL